MAADKKKPTNGGSYVFGKTSLDVDALRAIIEVVEASEVTRLVWQNGDEKLIIRRGNPVTHVVHQAAHSQPHGASVHVMQAPAPAAAASEPPRPSIANRPTAPATPAPEKKGDLITSPFLGTFYSNPSPDQPP